MRLLFISTTSTTAYVFLLPFARYLRERGHDVSFACSPENFADAVSRVSELRKAGFQVHEIAFAREIHIFKDIQALRRLVRLIRQEHYDLVHTFTSKAGFVGRIAAKVGRCPIIVHSAYDFYFRAYSSGIKRRFYSRLERMVAPLCSAMLFISETVRQEAIAYHLKKETDLVLTGIGIETDNYLDFQPNAGLTRAARGVREGDLLLGYVGRLVFNKGVDVLLRAMPQVLREYPQARLVVAGDGRLREELERLTASLGIGGQVQFVGFLPQISDVMDLMASLDVFVFPTRREGFGVVCLESMALGCPVVASRIPPVTEIVRDGQTGILVAADDPEDFSQGILRLLRDPDLRGRMAAAGPPYVKENFDLQRVFERTEKVYHQLFERYVSNQTEHRFGEA